MWLLACRCCAGIALYCSIELFSNGFFQIDYSASSDILSVALPPMDIAELSEAKLCFELLVAHVRNYQVENLLLDSSQAIVGVADRAYNRLIYQVSMELKATRLKKVARIVSSNTQLEELAVEVQQQVLQSAPATYQIKNFTSKELALEWLTGKLSSVIRE